MLYYTQEELLEKIEKAINDNSQSKSVQSGRQSALVQGFLVSIKNAVEKNKEITVKNIKREITNEIGVKRPKWIDELKTDNGDLEKQLKNVISAIDKQEVVREVSIKKADWLTKSLKQTAEKRPDYSSLLKDILVEAKKEAVYPTKMKVTGNVKLTESVSIKQPKWYNPTNYTSVLSSILATLKKPLTVKLQNPITFDKDVLDVKVTNPPEELEVYIKDGKGRIIDFDRQFGRMAQVGGSGAPQEMKIIAEDIDNLGVFQAIQGQYNDDGHFELLTAGSGGSIPVEGQFLTEDGDGFVTEDGDSLTYLNYI